MKIFFFIGMLLTALTTGAQKIEEIPAVPLRIGYEKTLHLLFPAEVKYLSIGNDNVIGEKVGSSPNVVRLKAAEANFPGETNLSVVTADTRFYSYAITYAPEPKESFLRIGGGSPAPHTLPVGKEKYMYLIFPGKITYVDYGSTDVEVSKAEGVDNILAVKATGIYKKETNISAIIEGGKFYTFNLQYANNPERFTFVIDKQERQKVAILDEGERSTQQKQQLADAIDRCTPLDLGLKDKVAGMEFSVDNIFVDKDILLFRIRLANRTQIDYTIDFMRLYIQDAKIRKKTAVQQIEQNILFTYGYPSEIPAHESRTFTVALGKFTIPDKKRLIIEIQEKNGGRHFLYKLKNKSILNAEEVAYLKEEQAIGNRSQQLLQILNR